MKNTFFILLILIFVNDLSFAVECKATDVSLLSIVDSPDGSISNIWNHQDKMNLSFCVSDKFGKHKQKIKEAVLLATEEWMSFANIQFHYIETEDPNCDGKKNSTLFAVKPSAKRLPFKIVAFFPYAEKSKRMIRVNARYLNSSFEYFYSTMLHELGHVLGLRHEHIHKSNPNPCRREDRPYKHITEYDPYSVMHYKSCGGKGSLLELSHLDKKGISSLYPF